MDNVLIDDRRIHVDFSQSVAKIRWKGKGRCVVVKGESVGVNLTPWVQSLSLSQVENFPMCFQVGNTPKTTSKPTRRTWRADPNSLSRIK